MIENILFSIYHIKAKTGTNYIGAFMQWWRMKRYLKRVKRKADIIERINQHIERDEFIHKSEKR